MENTVSTLLILGNGFDLNLGMSSHFSDYYQNRCEAKIELLYDAFEHGNYENARVILKSNEDDINFWTFLFYVHYYGDDEKYKFGKITDTNWFDIEHLIYSVLTKMVYNKYAIESYVADAIEALAKGRAIRGPNSGYIRENPYIFLPFIQNTKIANPASYLLKELHRFEDSFKSYMKEQIGADYPQKCHGLLKKIIGESGDFVDVINFNYSVIEDNVYICNQTNVHGRLSDEEIVIGIDSNEVPHRFVPFTKTFRNLHREKEPFRIPPAIDTILFYGHSLSEADFSYFYSIFDMYDLYKGSLKLAFLYSDYRNTEEENEMNHTRYVNQIYKLINKYSSRAHGETNLLHRLLLEDRVSVKRI